MSHEFLHGLRNMPDFYLRNAAASAEGESAGRRWEVSPSAEGLVYTLPFLQIVGGGRLARMRTVTEAGKMGATFNYRLRTVLPLPRSTASLGYVLSGIVPQPNDRVRLWTLLPLDDVEFHFIVLFQRLVPVQLNR